MKMRGWVEMVGRDFGYALPTLRRSRGFAAVAALTLALGIGANTAIFTLLDQILLRLLPVKNPQQLLLLTMRGRHYGNNWGGNAISYPMYRDFQDHNEVFSGMFCRFPEHVSMTFGGQSERVAAELVSGTYFSVLGVGTAVGRAIGPDDDRVPNGHPLVMLSYDFWKQRFGGDSQIVGKTILVNNHQMTIIGVAQAGFDGVELGYATKIFVPAGAVDAAVGVDGHDGNGAADCVREYRELAIGAGDGKAEGNCGAAGDGSNTRAHRHAIADRNAFAFGAGRNFGIGAGVLGRQGADGDLSAVGFGQPKYLHSTRFAHFGVYAGGDGGDRSNFWAGTSAAVYTARRWANPEGSGGRGGWRRARAAAERVGGHAGSAFVAAADWRGIVFTELEESEQPGHGISGGASGGLQH